VTQRQLLDVKKEFTYPQKHEHFIPPSIS